MKNRTDAIKLADGQFQFAGSDQNSNILITAGYLAPKKQWVITQIDVKDTVFVIPSQSPPHPAVGQEHYDTTSPTIVFTNHAKKVLNREFLDHRIIEQLIRNPDKKQSEDDGKIRFMGWVDGDNIHTIAKFLEDENKWLVITIEMRNQQESSPNPIVDLFPFDGEPTDEHPGITFTSHALERMKLRSIYKYEVKNTILDPDKTIEDQDDKVKFIGKELSLNRAYHVVAKFLPEDNKWLVISVWVRGEEDDGSLSTWKPPAHSQTSSGLPRIVFTKHMRQRMERHGIDGSHIEQAILDPQEKFTQSDGKVKFKKRSNETGKVIDVIAKFLPEENKWLVITAYYKSSQKSNQATIIFIILLILVVIIVAALILQGNS